MRMDALLDDPAVRSMFTVLETNDPGALDGTSRLPLSRVLPRVADPRRVWKYQLRDRSLWRQRFQDPVFSVATRSVGSILVSYLKNRFETDISVDGEAGELICFVTTLHGKSMLVQNGDATTATASSGLISRPGPGLLTQTSDNNVRWNVILKVTEVEEALERMLDERLRRPLEFRPRFDWTSGLSASLKRQLDVVMHEFQLADGATSSPVAMASMTDHLLSMVLCGAPHNYSDRLGCRLGSAVPAYIRRAEDYMRAHCAEPIRIAQVAEAAGCSVGTLGASFRKFRGRTPLGALHALRLERAYEEIISGRTGASVATIGRRYGFTNAGRFTAAFRRRFGETPLEVARRTLRS
jgi:AraC-like DNA-binding protein